MPDLVPHALRRILLLRHFPLLETAELGDLALVAENLVDTSFLAGATITRSGARPSAVHLIISGKVVRPGRDPLGPGSVLGALEVFAKRDVATPAVAAAETRTLQLNASDIYELLEDNFGLMRATVRDLAARLVPHVPLALGSPLAVIPGPTLGLVDRMMLLRGQAPFAGVRLEALAALAHGSEEIRWHAGTVVARPGEHANGAYIVATGEVRVGDDRVGPGHAIGALETLGEVRHPRPVVAMTEVRALACSASAIFDVIEDHADFGIAMIATFAEALLAAPRRPVN